MTFAAACLPGPRGAGFDPEVQVEPGVIPAHLDPTKLGGEPGFNEVHWNVSAQGLRSATLWMPETRQPRRLVIWLHGAITNELGRRRRDAKSVSRALVSCLAAPALSTLDPIIIAPHSSDGQWWKRADTSFVLGLVVAARERWPQVKQRSVITGYSNGGIATWYFARLYPEYFTAAIPLAFNATIVGASPLPIYAIAGEKDELFSIQRVRSAIENERANGTDVVLDERHRAGHMDVCAYRPELARAGLWLERHAFPMSRRASHPAP